MEDCDRLTWPQASSTTSLTSSNPLPSLSHDEDLLDFELESETCLRSPPNHHVHHKYLTDNTATSSARGSRHSSGDGGSATTPADKEYSFFASDEVVSGLSVNVAFFPDASRSAGESSSNEEDVVAVSVGSEGCDDGSGRADRKSRKNRKKKK